MQSFLSSSRLVMNTRTKRKSVLLNQQTMLYAIRSLLQYVINPKKEIYKANALMTYQSFGLDKNKGLPKKSFIFVSVVQKRTIRKPRVSYFKSSYS